MHHHAILVWRSCRRSLVSFWASLGKPCTRRAYDTPANAKFQPRGWTRNSTSVLSGHRGSRCLIFPLSLSLLLLSWHFWMTGGTRFIRSSAFYYSQEAMNIRQTYHLDSTSAFMSCNINVFTTHTLINSFRHSILLKIY